MTEKFGFAHVISIHALRVEGDVQSITPPRQSRIFLSTPSGWRATTAHRLPICRFLISIHALRVEGDVEKSINVLHLLSISIHALRVEGD